MEICDFSLCTGCSACFNACVKNAISMKPDKKGFIRPVIDYSMCVNCNLCKKVCPANCSVEKFSLKDIYAAVSKNDAERERSSSGGIFSLLARSVLKSGGVVCGAVFDDNMKVVHTTIREQNELWKLQGSKYVQSEIGEIYKNIKKYKWA